MKRFDNAICTNNNNKQLFTNIFQIAQLCLQRAACAARKQYTPNVACELFEIKHNLRARLLTKFSRSRAHTKPVRGSSNRRVAWAHQICCVSVFNTRTSTDDHCGRASTGFLIDGTLTSLSSAPRVARIMKAKITRTKTRVCVCVCVRRIRAAINMEISVCNRRLKRTRNRASARARSNSLSRFVDDEWLMLWRRC